MDAKSVNLECEVGVYPKQTHSMGLNRRTQSQLLSHVSVGSIVTTRSVIGVHRVYSLNAPVKDWFFISR